jgi:hypothetical protein
VLSTFETLLSWLSIFIPGSAGHDASGHAHSSVGPGKAHLQPAHVEKELQECVDRHNKVHLVAWVSLSWIQKLPPNQASQEEAVHCHGHHLGGEKKKKVTAERSQQRPWNQETQGWESEALLTLDLCVRSIFKTNNNTASTGLDKAGACIP